MKIRICKKCGVEKGLNMFPKHPTCKDGHLHSCKECTAKQVALYIQRIKDGGTSFWLRNKERNRETQRRYRATQKYKEYNSAYQQRRKKSRPDLVLKARIMFFANRIIRKNSNSEMFRNLVGYTGTELKKNLESKFSRGMSWKNYGEWEIDHIVPQSKFSTENIKDCWALSNLRPLWKSENLLKNNSMATQSPA